MASVLIVECRCGNICAVYVPKATLVALIGDRAEFSLGDAVAWDLQEQADGEVELSEGIHRKVGNQWVDSREGDGICSSCGCELGWRSHLEVAIRSAG
jgi:hypothetical protein